MPERHRSIPSENPSPESSEGKNNDELQDDGRILLTKGTRITDDLTLRQKTILSWSVNNPLADKYRALYQRAVSRYWNPDSEIDWTRDSELREDLKPAMTRIGTALYSLELMGLHVISTMMERARRKFQDENMGYYLSCQVADEARHVYVIENYFRKVNVPLVHQRLAQVLGNLAHLGPYRVENWLFSTLFSEIFASTFLQYCLDSKIDDLGKEAFRNILRDEARHVSFIDLALKDTIVDLSFLGRNYVKLAQTTLMRLSGFGLRQLREDADRIGVDAKDMVNTVFDRLEKEYEEIGFRDIDVEKMRKIVGRAFEK